MSQTHRTRKGLMTKENFKGLAASYGFARVEKGTYESFNKNLDGTLEHITKHAMYQADHDGKKGLSKEHARKAIELTPEVPDGVY